jgi:hypothetical protein
MSEGTTPTFRYLDCGHSWKARSSNPKSAQCSRCKSRKVTSEASSTTEPETVTQGAEVLKTSGSSERVEVSLPRVLLEDVDVRNKMKELQLARLERQIAKEKNGIDNTSVLDRTVTDFKLLVMWLNTKGSLDPGLSDLLETSCPWCGAQRERGMFRSRKSDNWKCRSCGKEVG